MGLLVGHVSPSIIDRQQAVNEIKDCDWHEPNPVAVLAAAAATLATLAAATPTAPAATATALPAAPADAAPGAPPE